MRKPVAVCWDDRWKQFGIALETEGCEWRCWLQPKGYTSEGHLEPIRWEALAGGEELKAQYQAFLEITCEEFPSNPMEHVPKITEAFYRAERRFEQAGKSELFYDTVSHLLENKLLTVSEDFRLKDYKFLYMIYTGLCLYLQRRSLYKEINAYTTLAFCAWQRYNLAKRLFTDPKDDMRFEIVYSYQQLERLLSDGEFSYAFDVIWQCAMQSDRKEETEKEQDNRTERSELAVENMKLSLFLNFRCLAPGCAAKEPTKPLPAPFCFQDKDISWGKVELSRRFRQEDGRMAVRKFIRQWLLPRYNLGKTVRMARMLVRDNVDEKEITIVRLIVGLLLMFGLVKYVGYSERVIENGDMGEWLWAGILLNLPVPAVILAVFLFCDWLVGFEMLLPRVWGGIFVGYAPLAISGEAWILPGFFRSEEGNMQLLLFIMFCLFSVALALLYFFKEAAVYTSGRRQAFKRALCVWAWAVGITLLLGALVCQFANPILGSIDTDPDTEGIQQPDTKPDWPGILGKPVPLTALFTFAPLALIIGIMVQILWEERPSTATVWGPAEK